MSSTITVENSQLGKITVAESKIATFPEGLIGFENLKRFAIIDLEEFEPFQWLLCIDDPEITFPIISPILVIASYEPEISREEAYILGDFKDKDLLLYTIVTIRPEINKVTANLKGPLIIDQKSRLGQQIVLQDDRYSTNQEFMSVEEGKDA
ncbi:flagellar assembly protein FliW [candidate division KSB1 bacterium]